MLEHWLNRLASPSAAWLALAGAAVGLALWTAGQPSGPAVLRFSGVLLVTVGIGMAIRTWADSSRAGSTSGPFHVEPLPFFDHELGASALAELRKRTGVAAASASGIGLAALGIAAVGLGAVRPHTGLIELGPTAIESWTWTGPPTVERGLGYELSLAGVDGADSATVALAPIATRVGTEVALTPGDRLAVGGLDLRWVGVTATPEIGAVTVTATRRSDGARASTRLRPGQTVTPDGMEGVTLRLAEVDPNRLGALGPAVLIEARCGDEAETAWLHQRSPSLHAERSSGCVGLGLDAVEPASILRFTVSPSLPLWLTIVPILGLVWLVGSVFVAARRPVFVRGRDGDYEIVILRGLVGDPEVTASRAAEKLLGAPLLAEWRKLRQAVRSGRT